MKLAILIATALAAAGPAFAQSAADKSELLVTGRSLEDSLPEQIAQSGVRVDVITDKAIRNANYVDVAQSLQALAPGLYIQPKNGPFDYVDISLLGSRTDDVLWLVDGVRINNRLYSGTTPLDTFPSSIVDRLEVLEGGQALFYGTAAVAGAVNIVTKPFTTTPSGELAVAGDSNTGRHVDGNFSDGFGKSQVVVYGSADQSDGYQAFRDQDYQPSSTDRKRGYKVATLGAKYAYAPTQALRVTAAYQHTWADLDFAQPYRVARNVNSRNEDLATLKLDYEPGSRLSFYLKGYYHSWDTHYDTTYNDLMTPGTQDVLYQHAFWGFWDYGANALGKLDLSKGVEAYFGYDLQRYGGRDEVLVIERHDETTQAVFGQLRLTPELVPHLRLAAGVRYNHPDVGRSASIWNVSGQYDFNDFLYVRGEGGTNFRLPTAEELFANDPQDERGNPAIKPEKSRSINVSVGGRFGMGAARVHWELIGFARNIDNLIDLTDFDPVTGQDLFGNAVGTVRVRGGELAIDAELGEQVTANLSYTYNRSRRDNGAQLDRVPRRLFKASLDYHPADRPFGATASLSYTGEVSSSVGGVEIPYGRYAVVDISGRWFLDGAHRHQLALSLQNLFDQRYGRPSRGCADTPADGPYDCSLPYVYVNLGLPRTLRGSYTYRF